MRDGERSHGKTKAWRIGRFGVWRQNFCFKYGNRGRLTDKKTFEQRSAGVREGAMQISEGRAARWREKPETVLQARETWTGFGSSKKLSVAGARARRGEYGRGGLRGPTGLVNPGGDPHERGGLG